MNIEATRVPARSNWIRIALAVSLTAGLPFQAAAADLCAGLVTDKAAHPMTALAKPALGQVAVDPQFGTKIRRITAVPQGSGDSVIKPEYSTKPAWNADESKLLLYEVGHGHKLYDGKTYAFIRDLSFNTNEAESAMWHATNPDILYYLTGNQLVRYNVGANTSTVVRTFTTPCGGNDISEGHMYAMSWDSNRIGLTCSGISFTYEISSNTILGQVTSSEEDPPQFAPSGNLAYWARTSGAGQVVNPAMSVVRTLDLDYQDEHASLGRKADGTDFYAVVAFDPGPRGIGGVGSLVVHDMTTGTAKVVVGQSTGYPYPPTDTHLSTLTIKDPGWVLISVTGNSAGQGVLDNELVLANANTNQVCRVAHVRTTGKANTHLNEPYWAEAHGVPSPTGTRIAFASDWGNGATVDTYVVELPAYQSAGTGADLAVTLQDNADPIALGTDVTLTATTSNVGNVSVTNASVKLTLPAGLAFVSSVPASPTCVPSGSVVTCALGTLAPSASSVVTVRASATSGGAYVSQATVSGTQTDPVPANNTASQTTSFQPQLRLGDASVAEGQSGTKNLVFTATLSGATSQAVTAPWATANGTAASGSDFATTSGTLTFAAGVTSQTLSVPVMGDTTSESDETFYVNVGTPANVQVADGQGLGTITNDDAAPPPTLPTLSVADNKVREPGSGTVQLPFTVTLSKASTQTVTVRYATSNGTATAGTDYVAASGTLTFAPGTTVATVPVTVKADSVSEQRETFYLDLSSPAQATLLDGRAIGTIRIP